MELIGGFLELENAAEKAEQSESKSAKRRFATKSTKISRSLIYDAKLRFVQLFFGISSDITFLEKKG